MVEARNSRRHFLTLALAAGGAALTAFDAWGAAIGHGAGNSPAPEPSADFKPVVES